MDVFEAIHSRRSVRKFKPEAQVPAELLHRIIDAARWAPSAGNMQPAEFIIVRDPAVKQQLVGAALGQSFIAQAPVIIVVCADTQRSAIKYGERGKILYSIQDTAASIQNLMLAAHDLGLSTCWIGAFYEDKVAEALGAPPGVVPMGLIPLGYSDSKPAAPPRPDMTDVIHFDKYGNKKVVQSGGYTTHEAVLHRPVSKKRPPTLIDVFKA